jgi:serine protease inhibitor
MKLLVVLIFVAFAAAQRHEHKTFSSEFSSSHQREPINRYHNTAEEPKNLAKSDPVTEDAVISYSWNLFQKTKSPNFGLSPLSSQLLLAYLTKVAEGETLTQIKDGIKNVNLENLSLKVGSISNKGKQSRNSLAIKTAFFVDKSVTVKEEFHSNANTFNIGMLSADFEKPEIAIAEINRWVTDVTNNLIQEAISPSSDTRGTKLIMINAITFNGKWKKGFTERKPRLFEIAPQQKKMVNCMNQRVHMNSGVEALSDELQVSWVEIPYDSDEYSMFILMPKQRFQLDAMIQLMTKDNFKNITTNYISKYQRYEYNEYKKLVNLTMPVFNLKTTVPLRYPLSALGISDLFNEKAQLPNFAEGEQLKVDGVLQSIVMDVNESGTQAAATTVINVIQLSAIPAYEPIDFVVNQPFVACIMDVKNNVPLFIARIDEP